MNCEIDDLIYDDPIKIFQTVTQPSIMDKLYSKLGSCCCRETTDQSSNEEFYEMQFNYIYMGKVCGDDKISMSRILKDCNDLALFEEEPIQHIIDYKWDTYTAGFFLNKFILYLIFLVFYYIDIERGLNSVVSGDKLRIKDILFYANKSICIMVQTLFSIYELVQMQ